MDGVGRTAAKYALVAAGAFILIVVTGLFAVSRNDERRLAQLEAELKGRQVSPPQVSDSPGGAATSDRSAGSTPMVPLADAADSTRGELAIANAGLTDPPGGAPLAPDASLERSPAEAVAPPSVEPSSVQPGAADPPADGWLHASQLPLQDEGAPTTTSWFASLESSASGETAGPVCSADRSLRTALVWAKSPQEAAEQARREGKLVFLIHVSGNFEDPGFT